MDELLISNARLLTLAGPVEPRRGHWLRDLAAVERGWVHISDGIVENVEAGDPDPALEREVDQHIDADGRVVMPAFVDCHTHACWAGDRFEEFEMKLSGASYLDVLKSGGGIMSTVRATRAATEEELTELLIRRIHRMATLGSGTIEVKSGYGLTTEDELKMLRAVRAAAGRVPNEIIPTFLGAHAIDPDNDNFIEQTITETLPAVVEEFPRIVCDAYCEEGAWSLDDTRRLFEEAAAMGCPIRVHCDQFNALGMTRLAVEAGALSVDHLEAAQPDELHYLASSKTIGVALPCSGFHLDDRYMPARGFVDSGGALAIATNYNPGSAPTPSMPFVIALACRKLGLTPAEAITACTYNAACVLQLENEIGSIEVGKRADMQMLDQTDERELGYEIASAGPQMLILAGKVVLNREISDPATPTGFE